MLSTDLAVIEVPALFHSARQASVSILVPVGNSQKSNMAGRSDLSPGTKRLFRTREKHTAYYLSQIHNHVEAYYLASFPISSPTGLHKERTTL